MLERTMNGPAAETAQMSHDAPGPGLPLQHTVMQIAEAEHDPALIRDFAGLKRQLAEVDARYMELGKDSLFDRVAMPVDGPASSQLKPTADPLALPMPKSGRAKVRSKLIRKLGWKSVDDDSGERNISASWTYFHANGKYLSMPDVGHADKRGWKDCEPSPRPRIRCNIVGERGPSGLVDSAIQGAVNAIDSGFYADACSALFVTTGAAELTEVPAGTRIEFWRQMARLCARNQNEVEVDGAIQSLRSHLTDDLEWLWEAFNARVLLGLAGHHEVSELADRVRNQMEHRESLRPSGSACWKSYMALWLNRHQRPNEALRILQPTLTNGEYTGTTHSVRARIDSQLAEAHPDARRFPSRRDASQGRGENLRSVRPGGEPPRLRAAGVRRGSSPIRVTWRRHAAGADLASLVWNNASVVFASALRTLSSPTAFQLQDEFPAARDLSRDFITAKAGQLSGLASCPLLAKVLAEWSAWCKGAPDPTPCRGAQEVIDSFWGV